MCIISLKGTAYQHGRIQRLYLILTCSMFELLLKAKVILKTFAIVELDFHSSTSGCLVTKETSELASYFSGS